MRLPKTVTIKGNVWKVVRANRITYRGNECYGLCVYGKRQIRVLKRLEAQLTLHTFMHELAHATLHEMHIDLGAVLDEAVCDGITQEIVNNFDIKLR